MHMLKLEEWDLVSYWGGACILKLMRTDPNMDLVREKLEAPKVRTIACRSILT